MKKKTSFLFVSLLFFLSACSPTVKSNTIEEKYFLYFSSTMDSLSPRGTVLSSDKESTRIVEETSGLELGKMINDGNHLYFPDQQNDYLYNKSNQAIQKNKRASPEHTGQYFSLFLDEPLSVYNSGYNQEGEYVTRFYYQNTLLEVNEFLRAMGQNEHSLYSIGEQDNKENYILSEYMFKENRLEKKVLAEIPKKDDEFIIGDLLYYDEALWVLYEKDQQIQLLSYNLNTSRQDVISLNSSMATDEVPFSLSNFSTIKEDSLYFVSTKGIFYQYDFRNKKTTELHQSQLNFSKNFILIWEEENVLVASYPESTASSIVLTEIENSTYKEKTIQTIQLPPATDNQFLYDFISNS